jgi:RecB family exonuclease
MDHLSASSVQTFIRCPEQGRRRYIEGEKIPPGWAAHRGSGTHKAVEKDLHNKLATGELLPAEAIPDLARDAVEHSASFGVTAESDEEKDKGFAKMLGETKDAAVRLALLHHEKLAPLIEPTAVEVGFEMETDIGIPLIGYIDVVSTTDIVPEVLAAEKPGYSVIRDTKTAGKKKNQADLDRSVQLSIYSIAYEAMTGEVPAVALDVLVDKKTPEAQVLRGQHDENQIMSTWNRIDYVAKMLKAGIFPPAPADAWNCSEKWCGYYKTCPFAGGARRAIVG